MKSLITLMLLALISCQKTTVIPEKSIPPASISNGQLSNSVIPYRYTATQPIDYTEFNPCTQEYVHVTGSWDYSVTWTVVNNLFNYTYNFHYNGITGIGLTTGITYKGTGHVTDQEQEQAVWNGLWYELKSGNTTNKIIFTSRIGGNFSSYAFYHFVVGSDGRLIVNDSRYEFNYCE